MKNFKVVSYTQNGKYRIEISGNFNQIFEPQPLNGKRNQLIQKTVKAIRQKNASTVKKTAESKAKQKKVPQTELNLEIQAAEKMTTEMSQPISKTPNKPKIFPVGNSAYVLDNLHPQPDLKKELEQFIDLFILQGDNRRELLRLEVRAKEQYNRFKLLNELYQKIIKKDSAQIQTFLSAQGMTENYIQAKIPALINIAFRATAEEIMTKKQQLKIEELKYKKTLQIYLHQMVHSFANRFPIENQKTKQWITFSAGLAGATSLGYLIKPDLTFLLMTPLWTAFTLGWRLSKDYFIRGKGNLQMMEAIKANNWSLFSIAPQFGAAWLTQKVLLLFSFSAQTQGLIIATAIACTYTGWAYLQDWWYDKNRGRFRLANAFRGFIGLLATIPFLTLTLPAGIRDLAFVVIKKVSRDLWSLGVESAHQLNHIKKNNLRRFEKFKQKILEQNLTDQKWFGLMIHVYGLWINEPQVKRHFNYWLKTDKNSEVLINHFKKLISLKNGALTQMLEGSSRKEEHLIKQYYQHLDKFAEWIADLEKPVQENFKQKAVRHLLTAQASALTYLGFQVLLDRMLLNPAYMNVTTYMVAIQNWWPALTPSLQITIVPAILAMLFYPLFYSFSKR